MALYSLNDFQTLVSASAWDYLNLYRATQTLDILSWANADLEELLLALHTDDFQKTVPNCKINDFENQDYVDADQYEIHWDETNCARCAYPSNKTLSFSLKIAIVTSLQGPLSGLVTFHFSGSSG